MSKITLVKEAVENAIRSESEKTAHLHRKAERVAAGIIVVTGFQLLDIKTLLESSSSWVKISCYLSLATLSLSLFFAFSAMRVKGYADYPRGNKLWDNLKPENVTEYEAQEALIQMLLQIREQNARLNDAKINSLFWCGWLLFIGFLLVSGSQLFDAFVDTTT